MVKCDFFLQESLAVRDRARVRAEHDLVRAVHVQRVDQHRRYADTRSSINMPFDEALITEVQQVCQKKLERPIDVLVVIAIGGSQLGTLAVHEALHGRLHNELGVGPRVYFIDTLSAVHVRQVQKILGDSWQEKQRVVLVIVSKSGTTLETVANACVLVELFKRQNSNARENMLVVTDHGSPLHIWAQRENIDFLLIPPPVGGRYSVLSAVGLAPLALMGVDINTLCAGAREAVAQTCAADVQQSIAAASAAQIFAYEQRGFVGVDFFVGDPCFMALGSWYRQLKGDSLGNTSRNNLAQRCALVPTVSVCSNDLHSVMQLYMGGLPKLYTLFVTAAKAQADLEIPEELSGIAESLPLVHKRMHDLMKRIFDAVLAAYRKQQKPYGVILLEKITPYDIGFLLQTLMLQMMYLGALFDVNAFDQPHVELYKREVRL